MSGCRGHYSRLFGGMTLNNYRIPTLLFTLLWAFACADPGVADEMSSGTSARGRSPVPDLVDSGRGSWIPSRSDGGTNTGGPTADATTQPRPAACDPNQRELCDDFDNDCDERVDEDCLCQVPEKPCYPGNPQDLASPDSACRAGTQGCRLEVYGECRGYVLPSAEVCDGQDNDCDGIIDNVEGGCGDNGAPLAICPPDQFGPPLANYTLRGGYDDPDGDPMAAASWAIVSKPPGSTATPEPNDQLETLVFVDLQGEYVLELTVRDQRGSVGRCQTRINTQSNDGLRVEMGWNVGAANDPTDLDLHLLSSPSGQWFDAGPSGDDCFYMNCKVCDTYDEPACRAQIAEFNANPNVPPPPQVQWSAPLDNDDPRLDLDDVDGLGPENLNINSPSNGTYRLGVHYYDDDGYGASTVTVRIFCGEGVVEQFGPMVLEATDNNGGLNTEFWEIADIRWQNGSCEVIPLGSQQCPRICSARTAENGGCPEDLTRDRVCL